MKHEINKFPPSLFKHGRFLREDWTACTDIGSTTRRGTLDKQEYLRVEGLYVDAVATLAQTMKADRLQVHDLEFWDTASDRLADLGLSDVFDGSPAPTEGEPATGARLANLIRRCLRGVAWLELIVAPKLLVHFGYDMRLIVASSTALAPLLARSGTAVCLCTTAMPHCPRSTRGSAHEGAKESRAVIVQCRGPRLTVVVG